MKTPVYFDGDKMRYIDADGEPESFYDIEAFLNDHGSECERKVLEQVVEILNDGKRNAFTKLLDIELLFGVNHEKGLHVAKLPSNYKETPEDVEGND